MGSIASVWRGPGHRPGSCPGARAGALCDAAGIDKLEIAESTI